MVGEILLAVGGSLLLVFPGLKESRPLGLLTLFLLACAAQAAWVGFQTGAGPAVFSFSGMVVSDRFGGFLGLAILAASMLVTLSMMGFSRKELSCRREFYALLLLTTAGLLLVVSAHQIALIYLGLELVSVLSYLMVGFQKKEPLASEAALKYFLFGVLSTGVMLYGISLLYGLTGTFDLARMAGPFREASAQSPLLCSVVLFLITAGVAFKLALVPFHMWAPDAYEGAPAPMAAFLSMGPKLAALAVAARFFLLGLTPEVRIWPLLFGFLAVLTMTVGNTAALAQNNVKRLLAYSSIAHAGTILIGLAVATPAGLSAVLFYAAAYVLMNAGAFAGVAAVGNASGREDLAAFSGLSRREPALAFGITVCFLSLAGIPPLAGFFAKMWIFGAALKAGAVWLAVLAALNSVVALFYYLKVIKTMYIDPVRSNAAAIPRSRALWTVVAFCAAGLFLMGLCQGPWLSWAAGSLPMKTGLSDLLWLRTSG